MKLSEHAGSLTPDEFSVASEVFERILVEQGIQRQCDDAEDVAIRIVHFAQLGLDATGLHAAATGRIEDAIALLTAPFRFPEQSA